MSSIVWIRRSLRTYDNKALVEASKKEDEVIPVYIVDQDFFSEANLGFPRVKFWSDSLKSLKESLIEQGDDLIIRKGKPLEEIRSLKNELDADKIYLNSSYSPYGRKRDKKLEQLSIDIERFKDVVMFEKREITTNQDKPYQVFSYYRDKWFEKEKPRPEEPSNFQTRKIESDQIPSLQQLGYQRPEEMDWPWNPGRKGGIKSLEKFEKKIREYGEKRDYPAESNISRLSPHLKFGTVSIREAFWKSEEWKNQNDDEGIEAWQEQLAWRDFYFQMLWNHPKTVNQPFKEEFKSVDWRKKNQADQDWKAFLEGKTGFPFVDAGMRQLRKEGWMHNRLRMVVTSFAAKDLFLDWRDLHNYFSKMFVDAEVAAMIGGIQWAYSIGTDAQPYFRVFNPWTQGEKYDPEGEYIRNYLKELSQVPDEYIHRPYEMPEEVQKECGVKIGEDYPRPIVDHSKQREKAIEKFEEARNKG